MNELHAVKFVPVTNPGAIVDDASFTTAEVDTLGYDYATFLIHIGATDIAMAALKLQESATSGSGMADITGANFSGGTDIDGNTTTLPAADDDDTVFVLQLDLKARQRYLDLVATAGNGSTGTYASVLCVLSKAEDAPTSVSGAGAGSIIRL